MARPTKQGIDYFPIDCQFDPKTEMYLIETEADGLAVLITIWQLIYQNEGYYINDDEDLHLLIKKRVNVDINKVNVCINVALKREIFNTKLHEDFGILTSRAVQKRFFEVAKRKKEVMINNNFIINDVNVPENAINVYENTTKESKVNKKKEEEKKEEEKKEEEKNAVSSEEILHLRNNDEIIDYWNSKAQKLHLSRIQQLSKTRNTKINLRKKEGFDIVKILEAIEKQPFLLGINDKNWKLDFDWLIANDTNWIKVVELKYLNQNNKMSKAARNTLENAKRVFERIEQEEKHQEVSHG